MHKFALPPTMAEDEFKNVWSTVEEDLKAQGRTFADEGTTEEKAREEYRAIAERRVRLGLVLAEIGDRNHITVTEEEIRRSIVDRARQLPGHEQQVWEYYQKNPQAVAAVRAPIFEDKVVDFVVELATVTEKEISREEQDAFALESYRRARAAGEDGSFAAEIAAVPVPPKGQKKGEPVVVDRDEEPWKVDLGRISSLRPAFQPKDGTVTAGNASKINDGAAALVLTTAAHASSLGVKPLARIVAHASHAQRPEWFTTAPLGAARAVLARAGLQAADVDLWEVNEAFAVVAMAFIRDLGLPPDRVNVHGGAVALGHPIGASGARILVTLLHALRARGGRLGCAAICIGGGEATAMVIERVD